MASRTLHDRGALRARKATVRVPVMADELERWRLAAQSEGIPLAAFIRAVMREHVARG